jgi:hypothetical protein
MADILDLDLDDIPDSLATSADAAELLERAI